MGYASLGLIAMVWAVELSAITIHVQQTGNDTSGDGLTNVTAYRTLEKVPPAPSPCRLMVVQAFSALSDRSAEAKIIIGPGESWG